MRFHARASRNFWWLQDRLGPNFFLSPNARAIEVVNEKTARIMGMVAYDNWTDNSAQVHIALDTPIAWRTLRGPAFQYPFIEAKRNLLIATVASDNLRSLRLTASVGFRQVYRIKNAVKQGVDFILFEMTRRDWEKHCEVNNGL